MSFADMKKNRMSFDDLSTKLAEAGGEKKSYADERMWYPKTDDAKNGYAVIRFLPTSENDDLPFVKLFSHGFKGKNGQWMFENCPTTVKGECPVCEANKAVTETYGGWDSTPEDVKNGTVRRRKRKMSYYSNVYIVDDPQTPENNGKVVIFRYGKKIFDKIMSATKPEFKDETPIQPFDMWEGANFKLKIRQGEGQTNYDSSSFEAVSQFLPDDAKMEAVWKSQYSLNSLIAADQFASYDDLKKRLNRIEGVTAAAPTAENVSEPKAASVGDKPKFKAPAEAPVENNGFTEDEIPAPETEATTDDDDAMNYFSELAED